MDKTKIIIGQVWRTRGGKAVKITADNGGSEIGGETFPFWGNDGASRNKDGYWMGKDSPHESDLVEIITDVDSPTPTPQATADAIFADAELQVTNANKAEPAGILGATESSEQRNEHIAQIVLRGMMEGQDTKQIRDFIDLYDSAVDGTSGDLTEGAV